ncbi:MAG TPA: hypothetical protein VJK05_05530 [archaeon]|nr:hypothetical protein [archaeon]
MDSLFVFFLVAFLVFLHLFADFVSVYVKRFHNEIISFSAGLFIALIFLEFIPQINAGALKAGKFIYFLFLAGFIFFHLTEKYVYQHAKDRRILKKEISLLHVIGFVLDQFIVGFAFYAFVVHFAFSVFIFVPLAIHTVASSLGFIEISKGFKRNKLLELVLSASPLAGAFVAANFSRSDFLIFSSFSLVLGALLYVVIRDLTPQGKAGKISFFLLGVSIIVLGILVF